MLEYDGADFSGFQLQRQQRTVQGELEAAVSAICGVPIRVHGAGRTDAGVHATGQVASFTTESRLGPAEWQRALNAHLPPTIAVRSVGEVPEGFHARFSATSRAYRYSILNRTYRAAIGRQYLWHVPQLLDHEAMDAGLRRLIGTFDFSAFAGASADHPEKKSAVRTILTARCTREQDEVHVDIEANAFLAHMVRNVVGTLVLVGKGVIDQNEIAVILESRERSRAGPTAPPHGLCLVRVNYGVPQ